MIGAIADSENGVHSGAVYVYFLDDEKWHLHSKLKPKDLRPEDFFGSSISISGQYALVGAGGPHTQKDSQPGAAYVYKYDGKEWNQQVKLVGSFSKKGNHFGHPVKIRGNHIIVGAPGDSRNGYNSGAAYVFENIDDFWKELSILYASDASVMDVFGYSVSITENYAVVGAHWEDERGWNAGAVYVFRNQEAAWNEEAKLTAKHGS